MSRAQVPEWMKNARDANEPEIIRRINALGGAWRACSRHEGHDGWVLFRERWYKVEVKNPAKKWTLTKAEKAEMVWTESNGGIYWILEYPADVDDMLGA